MADDKALEEIAGALTAHVFLLENIYALTFVNRSDPLTACERAARSSFHQFENLPGRQDRAGAADVIWRIDQHGLHRLERFWQGVELRIRRHLEEVAKTTEG